MRVLFDLTVQLYEVLLRVDKSVPHLRYIDAGRGRWGGAAISVATLLWPGLRIFQLVPLGTKLRES